MKQSIAIVGATGLVGKTLLNIFEQKKFLYDKIYLVASKQSAGKQVVFKNQRLPIYDLETFDFSLTTLAFFCVSSDLSATYIPIATQLGNVVIDKSNHYRNHESVPLIVPEVNIASLKQYKQLNIIANPNCNTIPIAVGLKPIYDAVGINRINISTYQSVSGTGRDAVFELRDQTEQLLKRKSIKPRVYDQQIAFNVLPHIDVFQENGYTLEEMKIVREMRKIYHDETLAINPTAVRVPVFCGHAASVHIETKAKITAREAELLLRQAPGVTLITGEFPYPTPVKEAAGRDDVFVGRVREDISHPQGLNLWIVADNLRKGAALNAVQIAEHLIKDMVT